MGDLFWTSMTDLARMIATKAISPVEVVRAHLERIAALDGELRSYITVCDDAALTAARAAEAQLMTGQAGRPPARRSLRAEGPLRYGRHPHHGRLAHLRRSGARRGCDRRAAARPGRRDLLGKLNMVEFAYGPEGLNPHYGHARNPWDRARRTAWPAARRPARASRSRRGWRRGAGLRHRRLDPHPGVSLRDHRPQADLWAGEPRRRAAARLVDGSRGPDDALGRRLRADAGRDGGL